MKNLQVVQEEVEEVYQLSYYVDEVRRCMYLHTSATYVVCDLCECIAGVYSDTPAMQTTLECKKGLLEMAVF